jgi:hypothetical protein
MGRMFEFYPTFLSFTMSYFVSVPYLIRILIDLKDLL